MPISCGLLLGVSLWEVYLQPWVGGYFNIGLFALCGLILAWMVFKIVTTTSRFPTPSVATPWAPVVPTSPVRR